ncbi:flagellar motor switch protein FliG [Leptospira kanakyensis]|uniref:Flagellar motor switch protein FliG n=1 Tax=Leptospira kanakyensis TaxID=2484968 RepID=A0A6N4Q564_9LEPT|nr:flagellar motor switch protein FliG [Leptospira kanakyensis]MCW7470589.1 flagellar motor switch protein FliG [Leptospira kanakyensis]MCW7481654.1 flagellar motor switch protein FliG [Leptospira kanakyensis]TGK53809.1 flagellar motor switch protein FliG [Leptospira kanakyensis]TGK57604.1 flagellar motor switch protein FliG [Leptospira kanakyensis]TGK73314.1 flagellar motor switch protein FliG [Leptospira kanakyensis]
MKPENSTSATPGVRKAALLLLSLGKERAADVLKHLDDSMLEAVILEMSKIRSISKEERDVILGEFHNTIEDLNETTAGGLSTAKSLLEHTVGTEKANVILKKIHKEETKNDFEFLNQVEPGVLQGMLGTESPQIIAVTLSHLDPKKAADVLKLFPKPEQAKIAVRLATTSKTHPDVIQNIARILKKRYEERDKQEYSEAGGAHVLANILNFMEKGAEETILSELEETSPDVADQVREKLYTFEDILSLDNKEMRILINRLADDTAISLAIRGAGDEIRKKFLNNMSQNRSEDILDALDMKPRVTLREINEARSKIVQVARVLEEENQILFKKEKEEYIE